MSAPALGVAPPTVTSDVQAGNDRTAGVDRTWQDRYALLLLGLDVLALVVAGLVALSVPWTPVALAHGVDRETLALAVGAVWLSGLALNRCYQSAVVAAETGARRVTHGSWQALAAVSLASYVTRGQPSRLYVLTLFAVGFLGLQTNRFVVHRAVLAARRRGSAQRRVLAVGDLGSVQALAASLEGDPAQAYRLVGVCVPGGSTRTLRLADGRVLPMTPSAASLPEQARILGADTVAVITGRRVDARLLQRISYALEGQRVSLLVAPTLSDVPVNRLHVRPAAGLPLLHLDEPELDGPHKALKGLFDRSVAAVLVLLMLPVLVGLWAAVRVSSPGSAIFKQARVGRDGRIFQVWKFRSMYPDAEARLAELMQFNEHQGPLFKMRNDPRITPIGRFIRKWSLDELPQLINVLKGDMSLVGPRPPLPSEVAKYDGHAHRRLLVKPGITGLWQVSGRADLDWEEAVRLDLAYVDRWSLGFDVVILFRTAAAVLKGSGAY